MVFAMMMLMLIIIHQPILLALGKNLIHQSSLKKCDVITVLGGDPIVRVKKAAQLFHEGLANEILLCVPISTPDDVPYRDIILMEGRITKGILKHNNVPEDRLHWSNEAFYSTYSEAEYVKKWMLDNNKKSIIIVSGQFHSSRAYWTFERMFEDTDCQLYIDYSPNPEYSESDWWRHEQGVIDVQNEYLKWGFYLYHGLILGR